MGLDMYLTKEIYIGANYDHNGVKGTIDIRKGGIPLAIDLKKVTTVVQEVACWRKANSIHQWFVDNCQEGIDECQKVSVSREKLTDLLDTVEEVLNDFTKADRLLPTQGGFFFGNTDYDEWYIQDLRDTKDMLIEVLANSSDIDQLYYRSSW
jgi:hypothetical protein